MHSFRTRIAGPSFFALLLAALVALALSPAAGASGKNSGGGNSGSGNSGSSDNSGPGDGDASIVPAALEPPPAENLDEPSAETCPGDPRQPFTQWDDHETYMLAPGGAFEDGPSDWFVDGEASLLDDNEPWYAHAEGDTESLDIESGTSVTSSTICITRDHPNFRFFARSEDNVGARLKVEVLFRDKRGRLHDPKVGVVTFDSGQLEYDPEWQVSPQLPVVANNYLKPGESDEIEIRFTPVRSSWQIDDVYVDPRHRS